MNGAPALDRMAGEQHHAQFVELEARLIDEHGSDRGTMVHRTVSRCRTCVVARYQRQQSGYPHCGMR